MKKQIECYKLQFYSVLLWQIRIERPPPAVVQSNQDRAVPLRHRRSGRFLAK